MANDPPLPPGFTLDAESDPPLPAGFVLDQSESPAPTPQRSMSQELGRQTGLAARYAIEGVAALPAMLANVPASVLDKALDIAEQASGRKIEFRFGDQGAALSNALTDAGLPQPETASERVVGDASRAVASAGLPIATGAKIGGDIGATLAMRPTMQAASAVTGASTAGTIREQGGGTLAQLAGSVIGGMTPYMAVEGTKAIARGARALVEPLFESGRQKIVGRTLNEVASNPTAAQQNMERAAELVPGSKPTAGEVAKDYGIISAQRGAKASNPAQFAERSSQQNTARQDYLSVAAKDHPALDKLIERREQVTTSLRNAAFIQSKNKPVNDVSMIKQIDDLLADPDNAGETTQKALQWAKGQLEGKVDARAIYAVRKDIAMKIAGKVGQEESVLRYAGKELGKVQSIIDDHIEQVAPVWKQYLTKYRQLSRPIDRMSALQESQQRASYAPSDALTGREVLTQAKWKSQVKALVSDANLTKGQKIRIERIASDLDRGMAMNDPNIRAIGSNTTQDMTAANVLGQMIGSTKMAPFVRSIARPLQWVYKIPEQELQRGLTEAMLDPTLGAALMKNASGARMIQVSELLRRRFVAAGIGTGAGLASEPAQAERNTQPLAQ